MNIDELALKVAPTIWPRMPTGKFKLAVDVG